MQYFIHYTYMIPQGLQSDGSTFATYDKAITKQNIKDLSKDILRQSEIAESVVITNFILLDKY